MPAWARRAAFVAAGLFAMVALVSSTGVVAPPARLHGLPAAELLSKARVICETRQEGKNVRTPAGMSCATCLANQKRDSDSCTRSGDLMQQSACVNRVNAEYLKCIPGCH